MLQQIGWGFKRAVKGDETHDRYLSLWVNSIVQIVRHMSPIPRGHGRPNYRANYPPEWR